MQVYGFNRHGGKSNSDIIIHVSGEGFNELDMFCDAALKTYKSREYVEGSTCDNVVKIAKELQQMMDPLDDNPKQMFNSLKK